MTTDHRPIELVPGVDLADFCLLSTEELSERRGWIDREIAPHTQRKHVLADGVAWDFDASAALRERLERLVALERQCCGPNDVAFSVRTVDADTLRLEIRGAAAIARARAGETEERRGALPLGRIARAGGLGVLASFVVCCVLPIAAVSLLGAAVAAPLLQLDNPWVILGVALVIGVGAWRLESTRRAGRAQATQPQSGCGCSESA
jgi:hypothetical protein